MKKIVSASCSMVAKLFSVGLNPMPAVTGTTELVVFGQLACVGVHDGAMERPLGSAQRVDYCTVALACA